MKGHCEGRLGAGRACGDLCRRGGRARPPAPALRAAGKALRSPCNRRWAGRPVSCMRLRQPLGRSPPSHTLTSTNSTHGSAATRCAACAVDRPAAPNTARTRGPRPGRTRATTSASAPPPRPKAALRCTGPAPGLNWIRAYGGQAVAQLWSHGQCRCHAAAAAGTCSRKRKQGWGRSVQASRSARGGESSSTYPTAAAGSVSPLGHSPRPIEKWAARGRAPGRSPREEPWAVSTPWGPRAQRLPRAALRRNCPACARRQLRRRAAAGGGPLQCRAAAWWGSRLVWGSREVRSGRRGRSLRRGL